MNVLYDHQTFSLQDYGGISRYFFELIKRFGDDEIHCHVSLLFTNNAYLNKNSYKGVYPFFPGQHFPGKNTVKKYFNQGQSVLNLKKQRFDIFHPTYYDPYFLNYLKGKPFVVTFLDIIHEKFADKYEALGHDRKIYSHKKILLENAAKVIAISQCTKEDITDIFGTDSSKIEVIHLGSSFNAIQAKAARVFQNPYLLFVGNRDLYKNFDFFLRSVAGLLKGSKIYLVCAGGGEFTTAELNLISKLGLKELVKHLSINDIILLNLYQNALAFVFPSLYEGFGIPILEAFSCGCPCLLSTGGSLREVAGDAAQYFDPENPGSIQDAFSAVIDNHLTRDNLIAMGYERLKLFSWDKTYKKTIQLYQSL